MTADDDDIAHNPQAVPGDRQDSPISGTKNAPRSKTYYVRWVSHKEDFDQLHSAGWRCAQSMRCHHNEYAVLMRAPEGWEP